MKTMEDDGLSGMRHTRFCPRVAVLNLIVFYRSLLGKEVYLKLLLGLECKVKALAVGKDKLEQCINERFNSPGFLWAR